MRTLKITLYLFMMTIGFSSHGQAALKILSYNSYEGFQGSDELKGNFLRYISEVDPDVVAFQELNSFTAVSLAEFAKSYGHEYAEILADKGYYVGITSKKPIQKVERVKERFKLGYMYGKIDDFNLFVIHLDPHDFKARKRELSTILAHAAKIPKNEPILIMGDFNSLSSIDSSEYNTRNRLENAKSFRGGGYDGVSNFNNGEFDYSVIRMMKENGYYDTFEMEKRTFAASTNQLINKLITNVYQGPCAGGPCRIDYIWVNKLLKNRVDRFEIVNNKLTDVISDHFPLYIEIRN